MQVEDAGHTVECLWTYLYSPILLCEMLTEGGSIGGHLFSKLLYYSLQCGDQILVFHLQRASLIRLIWMSQQRSQNLKSLTPCFFPQVKLLWWRSFYKSNFCGGGKI